MDRKTFSGFDLKDASKGEVSARIATLNVKDHDGDVVLPGFFPEESQVVISAYGHQTWQGALPVGRGTVRPEGDAAIFDGKFFMDTSQGRDTFLTVKQVADLQEWSWGYDVLPGAAKKGEKDGEQVRFLGPLEDGSAGGKIHEVSPVLVGASVGTGTLSIKGRKILDSELEEELSAAGTARYGSATAYVWLADHDDAAGFVVFCVNDNGQEPKYLQVNYTAAADGTVTLADGDQEVDQVTSYQPKALSFPDDVQHALGCVQALVSRADALGALRAAKQQKEGRVLSAANRERLAGLLASLGETSVALELLLTDSDPNKHAGDVSREFVRFQRLLAHV